MIYKGDPLNYIRETAYVFENILKNTSKIKSKISELATKKYDRLILIGSGSSYNASKLVSTLIKKQLDIQVIVVYPIDFLKDIENIEIDNTLIMGVSQQGTSVSVISCIKKAKDFGMKTVSFSGEKDTPISLIADFNVLIDCGEEDSGATTKGFSATIITLCLFILELQQKYENDFNEVKVDFEKSILSVRNNLVESSMNLEEWSNEVSNKLVNIKDLVFVYDANVEMIMNEIVLKYTESIRIPVRAYRADEYTHGIYNSINDKTTLFFIANKESIEYSTILNLSKYYSHNKKILIDDNVLSNLISNFKKNDYNFFYYIYILQLIFVKVSRLIGIDLNIPSDPNFHKIIGSKIEE